MTEPIKKVLANKSSVQHHLTNVKLPNTSKCLHLLEMISRITREVLKALPIIHDFKQTLPLDVAH